MNILLRGRDIPDLNKLDVYVKNGGYEGLKKALGGETLKLDTTKLNVPPPEQSND